MAARIYPGSRGKRIGNRSVEELEKLLGSSNRPLAGNKIDMSRVAGSTERRTGISQRRTGVPADSRSASQRGTVTPALPSSAKRQVPPPVQATYKARGKTYTANPTNRTDIFLKNHPVLAKLKGPAAKNKFLKAHPKIAARASEVSRGGTLPQTPRSPVTNVKGPALRKSSDNYRAAILRRLRKARR